MENQDNNSELIKILAFFLIPIHIFSLYSNLFLSGKNNIFYEKMLAIQQTKLPFLSNCYIMNLTIVVMLLINSISAPHQKDKTLKQKNVIQGTFMGLVFIALTCLIFNVIPYNFSGSLIYICCLMLGYYFYIKNIAVLLKIIVAPEIDVFNDARETFPQMIEKVETPHSINIPYYFYYDKKWQKGWLNFVNPFRAILVAGSPGSGKSFGTINLAIHQLIHKNYCLYVYDFKIPTLALEVINGLWHYKEQIKKKYGSIEKWEKETKLKLPIYKQIDFKRPIKSHRINPIASYLITKPLDAIESSKYIMQGLSGGKAGNDNDFFKQSAESLLAACIFYLARRSRQYGQEFSTLPHVIELLTKPYEILFPLLMADPYIVKMASTFNNAFEKGVFEQLQGQVDSLRVPLTQLQDPNIYWIFSGNDFSMDISNPNKPIILVIGNNPDEQATYGILLSLLNGKLTKTINKKGQRPLGIIVDELPTLPFESLHSLIATARSNNVACILGIQDIAQFELNYGKEKAAMIVGMVGSILTGQIRGELAKTISDCIGLINQTQETDSISQQGLTINQQITLAAAVSISTIANLPQGEMTGTISDDFIAPLKYKKFHGKIDATSSEASPTTIKPITEIPDLAFPLLAGETEMDREQRVRITIRENFNNITKELNTLQYLEMTKMKLVGKEGLLNLKKIEKTMSEYMIQTEGYEDKNRQSGYSAEGDNYIDKCNEISNLFSLEISPFIGLIEAEVEDSIVDKKIIQPVKTTYTDFNSKECIDLQEKYKKIYEILAQKFTPAQPSEQVSEESFVGVFGQEEEIEDNVWN